MSTYNILQITMRCPRCGNTAAMEAEFRFGFLNLDTYQLGDTLRWNDRGRGLRFPKQRPTNGHYSGEAYVECPVCHKDFWLTVTVKSDQLERVDIDLSKPGYISDSS